MGGSPLHAWTRPERGSSVDHWSVGSGHVSGSSPVNVVPGRRGRPARGRGSGVGGAAAGPHADQAADGLVGHGQTPLDGVVAGVAAEAGPRRPRGRGPRVAPPGADVV